MSQKSSWISNIVQGIVMIAVIVMFNKYACSREETTTVDSISTVDTTEVYAGTFKVLKNERMHIVDTLCTREDFVRKAVEKEVNMIMDRKEQELDSLVQNKILDLRSASSNMNLFIRKLMYGI
jgi:hypothetical protein